jgi:glycosyltransferase involved in cell wall biosynthesis
VNLTVKVEKEHLLRIAQIAPLVEAVPPKLYGGTERIVSFLTEELVALGHDVTLFATGDSQTSADLDPIWPRAVRLEASGTDIYALHAVMFEKVARRADEFDLLHFHIDYYPFSLFSRLETPYVTTLHGRLDLPEIQLLFGMFPSVPVVSISDAQRRPIARANWAGTVYHGLPRTMLQPALKDQTYLAFLGRISPEKGLDKAIEIAAACGMPLKIAAKVDKADMAYFEDVIKPMLHLPGIELIGEIGDAQKSEFLSGATALLMPIDWPEPFGIVMIEAMACGTPVIAFNKGSAREVVTEGVTGFVVNTVEEAIEAVKRLPALSRSEIRRGFDNRYTADRMAKNYLRVYHRLLMDSSDVKPGVFAGNGAMRAVEGA